MPNHIKSRLEFTGKEGEIKNLVEDFSTFVPRKPSLSFDGDLVYQNKETNEYGWLNEKTNKFKRRDKTSVEGVPEGFTQCFEEEFTIFPDLNKVVPQLPDVLESCNNNEPGINPHWYDWRIQHWGTKWNTYSHKKIDEKTYIFETAWSGIPEIIRLMSIKYPSLLILYQYADEDTGYNCGEFIYQNGKYDDDSPINGSTEAYEIAFRLRPYLKEDYVLVDGEYKYKNDDDE